MTTVLLSLPELRPPPARTPDRAAAFPSPAGVVPPGPGDLAGRLIPLDRLPGRATARPPTVPPEVADEPEVDGAPAVSPDDLFARDFFGSPVLSRADTEELLHQIAALGPVAEGPDGRHRVITQTNLSLFLGLRNRVVVGHLRLAADAVRGRRSQCTSLTEADLFQEAVFGLMRAVELFDPDRGVVFSTYAFHWLRQAVGGAVMDHDRLIRLPRYCASGPDRLPPAEVVRFTHILPLDGFVAGLTDPRAPDPAAETAGRDASAARPGVVAATLRTLAGRDADILRRRFGLPDGREETLQELGECYGLSRERVRQIEARALEHLRHPQRLAALEGVTPT